MGDQGNVRLEAMHRALDACIAVHGKGSRLARFGKAPFHFLYTRTFLAIVHQFGLSVPLTLRTFWGDELQGVLPDLVSKRLFLSHYYEANLTEIIMGLLKPGMVFFDVGAHLGYYSLLAATLVGDEGQVHAFEATPSTFERLSRNLAAKKNARAVHTAVWKERATLPLHDYGVELAVLNSLKKPRLGKNNKGSVEPVTGNRRIVEVQSMPLDQYVTDLKVVPDFVKIDVESAEYEVLLGMEKTLTSYQPAITLEVGDLGVDGVKSSRFILEYMMERGYQPYEWNEQGQITSHELKDEYSFDNILLLKNQGQGPGRRVLQRGPVLRNQGPMTMD